jgi:hypothetical protein
MRPLSCCLPRNSRHLVGDKSRPRGAGLLAGFPQHLQAALGDEVVLVPPGVSCARGPLDGSLVLQFLYGIVVALTVRVEAAAASRLFQG